MQENRYSRHELLKEVGIEGQKRIAQCRVLIIGAGGLGSPASLYLASSGVKKITIVDSDMVDLTNLQRQVIHNMERLGLNKAESAKVALQAINPEVEIVPVDHRPSLEELEKLVSDWCRPRPRCAACRRYGAVCHDTGQVPYVWRPPSHFYRPDESRNCTG